MYSQNFQTTNIHTDDSFIVGSSDNKENVEGYIFATNKVFDVIKNSILTIASSEIGNPLSGRSRENHSFFSSSLIDLPSFFWVSYAAEQFLTPISSSLTSKKRVSTEIVKRYSLSKNVQKIYFSQVSFYVDVDIVLDTDIVCDEELDKFFDYEQQLLETFDIPMNFNYRPRESYFPHSENNVLIFEK